MNCESDDRMDPGEAVGRRGHLVELLGIFLVVCAANLFLFTAGYERSGPETPLGLLIAEMLTNVGWCLLVYVLLSRGGEFDWKLPRTGVGWAKECGWGFLLFLALIGCTYVISLIVIALGIESPTESVDSSNSRAFLTTICLFTPIIGLNEELLFRVYAQTRLTQVLRSKKALPVVIAALVFAAVHGYDIDGTLTVLTIGLVLGVSYQANGKIPRLVLAHTFWNIMVSVYGLLVLP